MAIVHAMYAQAARNEICKASQACTFDTKKGKALLAHPRGGGSKASNAAAWEYREPETLAPKCVTQTDRPGEGCICCILRGVKAALPCVPCMCQRRVLCSYTSAPLVISCACSRGVACMHGDACMHAHAIPTNPPNHACMRTQYSKARLTHPPASHTPQVPQVRNKSDQAMGLLFSSLCTSMMRPPRLRPPPR